MDSNGAKAVASAIWMARNRKSKKEIRDFIESRYGYDLSETLDGCKRENSNQEDVATAIVCFLESRDFEDAIRKAISLGGDTGSIACITGGLAEAFYGYIPENLAKHAAITLPEKFNVILNGMREKTPYGKMRPRGSYDRLPLRKKYLNSLKRMALPMNSTNIRRFPRLKNAWITGKTSTTQRTARTCSSAITRGTVTIW